MRDDLVTITASLLIRQEGARVSCYAVTMTSEPYRVASLWLADVALSETWREEFRALCQHIIEERFTAQGMRPKWVLPTGAPARAE
jgi:hypothetical protein